MRVTGTSWVLAPQRPKIHPDAKIWRSQLITFLIYKKQLRLWFMELQTELRVANSPHGFFGVGSHLHSRILSRLRWSWRAEHGPEILPSTPSTPWIAWWKAGWNEKCPGCAADSRAAVWAQTWGLGGGKWKGPEEKEANYLKRTKIVFRDAEFNYTNAEMVC